MAGNGARFRARRHERRARPTPSTLADLTHVPAGTGGQWPGARRLLPADRARPVADLQRRRHRQPGAWRVLCARRLRVGRDRESSRLRAGGRAVAGRGRAARHPVRAFHPAPLLHRRSDPQPARHLRPRDGGRAGDPHHLGRGAALRRDAAGVERLGHPRRLPVLALSAAAARRGRAGARSASGCCCTRPRSAAWCAPASSGPTWWRRSASGCSPT